MAYSRIGGKPCNTPINPARLGSEPLRLWVRSRVYRTASVSLYPENLSLQVIRPFQ